jgi:hypothetical protein
MPVEIKHISRINWNDILGIENPFFARSAIERDCSFSESWNFLRITGLDEALADYARWYSPYGAQAELIDAFAWLLDRVESGEYVLIRSDENWTAPMDSVLRWGTEGSSDNLAGHWKADPRLPMLMRMQIDQCLEEARHSGSPACLEPEREWWGGVVDGRIWKGGKEDSTADDSGGGVATARW